MEWSEVLPLAGVALGAWLTGRMEWRRWKRDWLIGRIALIESYFGEACEALDDQHRVIGQTADVVQGLRQPVPQQRVEQAGQRWGRVLARRGVSAPTEVQLALTAFDAARAGAAEAINGRDAGRIAAALTEVEAAYAGAMTAMVTTQHEMNDALAPLLLPRWVIVWRQLRGQPLGPR